MDRTAALRVTLSGGWLAHQKPAIQAAVLARAQLRSFRPGEYPYRVGDAPGGVFGVVSGGFAAYVAPGCRRLDLAHITRPPVWFGHGPMLTGRRRVLSFRASEPAFALHLSLPAIEDLAQTLPDAPRAIGAIADFTIDIAIRCVSDLLIRRADRRIAATLLRVTAAAEGAIPDDPGGFRLTQAELGEMANGSRAVVNRTLAAFKQRGWVSVGYQRIGVRHGAALAAFAYADEL